MCCPYSIPHLTSLHSMLPSSDVGKKNTILVSLLEGREATVLH